MKRNGIIHAELALHLATPGHTDTAVICDAGLSLAPNTPRVDLGYRHVPRRPVHPHVRRTNRL